MTAEALARRRIRTPVLAVTAVAWAATLVVHTRPSHGMGGGHLMPAGPAAGWPLMLVAMMAPLLIPALRHAYAQSLPRRRWRAMTLLVAAAAAIWSAAWLILRPIAGPLPLAVVLLAAVVWQVSPLKQRCLNRRHAHPALVAFDRAADVDALRFGCRHAFWCVGSCWALMLLPLAAGGWHLALMAAVTLWIWAEQFDTPVRPTWRLRVPVRAARIIASGPRPVSF